MLVHVLLVAHIAVLGYWLGSELVINSTYRYVTRARAMPVPERTRLLDHVMDVDQHVRYALVLQFTLGFCLLSLYGWSPMGPSGAWLYAGLGGAWLLFVELTHRWRAGATGRRLATLDRALRYGLMAALVLFAARILVLGGLPAWLGWKLLCFVAVMGCGVGIRLVLIRYFRAWRVLESEGSGDAIEARLTRLYWQATAVLGLLWVFIALAVYLSVAKPGGAP
jgi:hypothetical protein